ncbi:extracellular solute-binding protein [Paenibacillus sp. SC116]|uniref:ABC transporter substrate-binding protein n=1 Tax=Paenibacillus sp. SC116 TaxID=2968986 RepID=UPI00215B4005|nr:extracellular solute-binding protein [Paenibacillus sp. SC116]MCR8844603.1 extracellular solute-binding protein [Paenibacillus sp. SC116]
MKKSLNLLLVTMMVFTLALAGCGNGGEKKPADSGNGASGDPAAEELSLTLRHINVRATAAKTLKILEDVVKKTEEEIPGLSFKLDGVEDTVNRDVKLKAEMQNNNQPPIFNLFGGADTKNYAKAGRLLNLTPILEELGLSDQFFNLREFTVDGKVYGLPESGFVEGFFYNRKLFEEAGVQVPTTWEEFLKVCEALKAKGITPIALGAGGGDGWSANMLLNNLFVGLGGPEIQEGFLAGTSKWTDAPVVEAFKRIVDLKDKGFIDPNVLGLKYSQGQANFYTGKAAMLFDGSWAVSAITGEDSKVANDAGFFRMPNVGGGGDGFINGGWSNGYGFSANLKEHELKAVKTFIKNFYTVENQTRGIVETSRIPSMKGVTDLSGANELTKSIGEQQASSKGAFPAFDAVVQQEVKVTLESTIQEVLGGQISPEDAAKRLQEVQESANKK